MKKIFLSIIILLFSFWQAFSIWENYAFYSTSQLKEMYKKQDAEVEGYTRELLRQDLSDIEKFSKLKLSLKISFHIRDELREELASRLKDEEEGERKMKFFIVVVWIIILLIWWTTYTFRNKNI